MAESNYDQLMRTLRIQGQDEQDRKFREMTGAPKLGMLALASSAEPMERRSSLAGVAPTAEDERFGGAGAITDVKPDVPPAARPAARPASSTKQVAVIDDRGGYQYGQMSDGSFKILKSPLGGAGKIVRPGTKGYDAIKQHAESVRQLEAMYGAGDMAREAVESMNEADDVRVKLGSELYSDGEPNAGRRPGPPAF
jgi:hypothetical protein